MAVPVLYQEDQRFTNPYIWVVLMLFSSVIIGSCVWILIRQFVLDNPLGGNAMPPILLVGLGLIVIAIAAAVVLFFAMLRLQTEVTESGLYLRFTPMHRRLRQIDLNETTQVCVDTANGVVVYGGIGIRRTRKSTAYLLHGHGGVRIDFANGCHVYIGSYRAEELANAIKQAIDSSASQQSTT